MKKVAIIGLGYVGLGISVKSSKHYEVVGLDVNAEKVLALQNGESYIEGIKNEEVSTAILNGNFKPTTNPIEIKGSEIVIICVPTPLNLDREPDLSFIDSACDFIADNLQAPALVINESTSFPGTLRNHIKERIESKSSILHQYASSPERVDPGNSNWNLENTPRLISGLNKDAIDGAKEFYSTFAKQTLPLKTPEVAEMAKLFENTFRQVNIALVNELAIICNSLNIDVYEVLNAAATKPYGFMKFTPGPGVGGHCIPVDPTYLAHSALKNGTSARFIELANSVNLEMPSYIVKRCKNLIGDLKDKRVLICGVSYKSDIADTRETPADSIFDLLRKNGADVYWHDPIVEKWKPNKVSEFNGKKFDLTIIQVIHEAMNIQNIKNNSTSIFDCTGKVDGVTHL